MGLPAGSPFYRGVAQLVEHRSPKPGVGRSSRSAPAIFFKKIFNSGKMRKLVAYLKDIYDEMVHKVSWPTWDELQVQALVVMVATVIIAIVIWLMDFSFSGLMKFIYGLFY